ncbi:MAG: MJ1477/TM1410 family putative glycoside hydrolase [Hyphomicrobiaceae bacterium]
MTERSGGWREKATELAESFYIIGGATWLMAKPFVMALVAGLRDALHGVWAWWHRLDWTSKRRVLGVVAVIFVLLYAWTWREVPGNWLAHMSGKRPLYAAKTWHYQLDKVDVDQLTKVKADVIVTDFAKMGGKVALSREEVARLKIGPDGKKRFVIAYMSVGEAEQYRFYFRDEWKTDPPEWLEAENCAWPGAHKVKFWHDSWKDIVWRGRKSYLKQIVDAGFDGVYLDRVDIYDVYPERMTGRAEMIQFVIDLSETAKKLKPEFFVLPQNADDLLTESNYRAAIDGLGREDLLHGVGGTGKRNPGDEINAAQERMDQLLWEWKPVLAVEYLQTPTAIAEARKEMMARGLVPTFQPRALDGADPTAPIDLAKDVGTSEYTKANCEKGKAW